MRITQCFAVISMIEIVFVGMAAIKASSQICVVDLEVSVTEVICYEHQSKHTGRENNHVQLKDTQTR